MGYSSIPRFLLCYAFTEENFELDFVNILKIMLLYRN